MRPPGTQRQYDFSGPPMVRIRPWLCVGKFRATRDARLLAAHGVGAMLQLAEPVEQPGIASRYLPVEDGEPLPFALLREGVDYMLAARNRGQVVLVACGAGISRSTSFAIAALKEVEGLSLLESLLSIHRVHPDGLPHPALWQSLCDYYEEQVPFFDVVHALDAAEA